MFWLSPPIEEQTEIADFIRAANQRIDTLCSAYDTQIDLLTEYRAALIHECVTGQRPVPVTEAPREVSV